LYTGVKSPGILMRKLILCCIAVAGGVVSRAQTPTVVGVANDPPSSPTISSGAIGYVFGSGFGTAENTTVTVGGLSAQVLEVSGNQIRAAFPPNLAAGVATLTVTVDRRVSDAVNVIVSAPAPGPAKHGNRSVSAGPESRFPRPELPETFNSPESFLRLVSGAASGTGIVYTCDSTINTASATACNTLNTTIAALYKSAFSNANATIYVKLGVTGLGMSDWVTNNATYTNFRSLLTAAEAGANDTTAVKTGVPSTSPYGSSPVELPTALQRALGFGPPTSGLTSSGSFCNNLGSPGCYDGIITVSNAQPLYFRTGTISNNQYDFFTVVEHETDEVLGTASCAIYGCGGDVLPADFFRYSSSGAHTLTVGTNSSCASSFTTNACFSIDGVHMLQQYNNVNNGNDAGDWVPNCGSPLVQDYAICAGNAGVNISPAAEILVLDAVGYKLANSVSGALQFYPVAPCRLVDTRGAAAGFNGIAPFSGPAIASGGTLTIPVQSAAEATANTAPAPCGTIPSTAQAYSFNLTVVPHAAGAVNYVSLWPAGATQPFVATLNDPEGLIVANAAVVPAGTPSGGISVFNAGPSATDVVIDMNGYFAPPTSLQFYPVPPCRLVDTRGAAAGFNGLTPFSGPSIAAGGTQTIPVQSTAEATADTTPAPCGVIPSAAQAYSFNLTVVPHAAGAVNYVSLWPAGSTKPFVSTLDDPEGSIVANAAIVPAGSPSGGVSVFNAGPAATDVILDMNGYFAPPTMTGLQFYAFAPCRLVDTRGAAAGFNGIAPFSGPSIPSGGTLTIPVQSTAEAGGNTTPAPCGIIPSTAQAYSLNLTVVPHAGGPVDYVSLWAAGAAQPFVSTLDDPEGLTVANAAIVPAGTSSGGLSVFNSGPSATDVVIDMNGYFAP
jgi:hypothetical protein